MLLHHTPTGRSRYRLQHRHAAEADAAAAATTIIIADAAAAAGLLLDPLTKSQASAKKLHEFSPPKGLPCALQPKRNRQLSLSFLCEQLPGMPYDGKGAGDAGGNQATSTYSTPNVLTSG